MFRKNKIIRKSSWKQSEMTELSMNKFIYFFEIFKNGFQSAGQVAYAKVIATKEKCWANVWIMNEPAEFVYNN